MKTVVPAPKFFIINNDREEKFSRWLVDKSKGTKAETPVTFFVFCSRILSDLHINIVY